MLSLLLADKGVCTTNVWVVFADKGVCTTKVAQTPSTEQIVYSSIVDLNTK